MRGYSWLGLWLIIGTAVWAEELPDFISTPRGFTYQNVKVLSHSADSITFSYAGGTATLAIADLPQVWRDHFKMVDPAAPAALPAPVTGAKVYEVTDLKAQQHTLQGKIVPVLVAYDGATSLEAQDDGSFLMFVTAKKGGDFVVFPAVGAPVMKALLKSAPGEKKFFSLIRAGQPSLIVGKDYDAVKRVYTW